MDNISEMGKGKHKPKDSSEEVLDEVVDIVEGHLGNGTNPEDWEGDYDDGDDDDDDDDGQKPPPPNDDEEEEEEKEEAEAGSGSSSSHNK